MAETNSHGGWGYLTLPSVVVASGAFVGKLCRTLDRWLLERLLEPLPDRADPFVSQAVASWIVYTLHNEMLRFCVEGSC